MREPEPAERARERERAVRVVVAEPVEGGAQVVVVELEPRRPLRLGVEAVLVRLLGERGEERRVATPDARRLSPSVDELLERVLADRLEHQEAVVADRLQRGWSRRALARSSRSAPADLLRGLEREAAGEDARAARRAPGPRRRAGRSSIRSSHAASAGARARRARRRSGAGVPIEPLEERARARAASSAPPRARSRAAGRRGGGRSASTVASGVELPPDRSRALDEERRCVARRERLEPVLALADTRSGARLVTSTRSPARRGKQLARPRARHRAGARSCRGGRGAPFRGGSRRGRPALRSSARSPTARARGPRARRAAPRRRRRAASRRARRRPGARAASSRCRPGR